MNAKSLLIPVAAFAVTVTGVSAFNSNMLEKAGLNVEQISAFEEAHELRKGGDRDAARDLLLDAGIDLDTLEGVHSSMSEYRHKMYEAVEEAIESGDYEDFLVAIADSPLADIITSEMDFDLFVEAHNLKKEGEREAAREIMEDLGIEHFGNGKTGHGGHHNGEGKILRGFGLE